MKQWLLILALFTSHENIVSAQHQTINVRQVIDEISKLKITYLKASTLSFHVLYTYANENKSDSILDSIPALIQVSDNRYHAIIGPTETIADSQYAVMLFSDDKVMYITKPSAVVSTDPLAKLDSSLLIIPGLQTSVTDNKNYKIIKLTFRPGTAYKSMQLTVDKQFGFLLDAQFIVKASALPNDESQKININNNNDYALIRAQYFGYSKDRINDSVFDETRYFIRDNKNFTTTKEYKEYKIFIGSPNL